MYAHPQQVMQGQSIPQNRYVAPPPNAAYQGYPPPANNQYIQQPPYPQSIPNQQYSIPSHQLMNQHQPRPQHQHPGGFPQPQTQFNNKNAALIQPPALNAEEPMDTNSQFFQQRAPMTMSNNQHSQFDTYHQQQEDQMWNNEAQIASMFWEQRCMTMLQRFEWCYDRFQILKNQYMALSDEMQKMDSQEQWHRFQQHHDQFHEKIEQMQQQLSAVLGQNQQLLQQKKTQDNEGVWEQRYQQLLGNFKSLQDEMTHLQNSGGKAGGVISQEQYQNMEDQYAELEYQYGQVVNELQKYRDSGVPDTSHYQDQMNQYLKEIQSYKNKLGSLHNQNVELQNMLVQAEQQNQQLKQDKYKSGVDRTKFQQLVKHIQVKEDQIKKLQDQFKNRSHSSNNNQTEAMLTLKNKQIQQFRRLLSDKDVQIKQTSTRLIKVQENTRTKLREQFESERKVRDKKIEELEKQIIDLKNQLNNHDDHSYKTQNLQKKLNYANQQNHNLTQTLKKKNQQLIELRSVTYEIDKLKQTQNQFYKIAEQKEKAIEAVRKKNQDIQLMHQQIQKLTAKISQMSNKRQEFSTRNLMTEIQDLTEQIRRKDGDINKFKTVFDLKEEYSLKLQEQLRQVKEKNIHLQQALDTQRDSWREKQIKVSSKTNQFQKKIKNLDYEFSLQLKDTLQKEVNVLRKQNAQKQEKIRQQEENQLLLSSKLAIFQKQKDNFDQDISLLKSKQKQLIKVNEKHKNKYKELEQIYKTREEDIESLKNSHLLLTNQLNNLKIQIEEHQTLIKSKNRIIEELQESNKEGFNRADQTDRITAENTKLRMALNNAIEDIQKYRTMEEQLGKSKVLTVNNSRKQFEKQQSATVNQLYQQNQQLKQQIAQLLQKLSDKSLFIKSDSKIASVSLNKRLNQFNSKLQMTITGNQQQGYAGNEAQKTLLLWEKERKQLINHYENQIAQLNEQLNHNKLANSQASQQSQNSKKQPYYNLQSERKKDQILFYKQKSREQEERNAVLIKVNEELKNKIDTVIKMKQNSTTLDYYKQQYQKMQSQQDILKSKFKKLSEENKQIKMQLGSKNSKLTQEYQFKILDLQLAIQQQQRKITYLQSERVAADNQKANLLHHLNIQNLGGNGIKQQRQQYIPDSPKYTGIQQQFNSVIGNLRGNNSPKSKSYMSPSLNNQLIDSKATSPKYYGIQSNSNQRSQLQKV